MYKSIEYDAKLSSEDSWRILRVTLVLETGLPFEYWDDAPITNVGDIVAYKSGKNKAEEKQRRSAKKSRKT